MMMQKTSWAYAVLGMGLLIGVGLRPAFSSDTPVTLIAGEKDSLEWTGISETGVFTTHIKSKKGKNRKLPGSGFPKARRIKETVQIPASDTGEAELELQEASTGRAIKKRKIRVLPPPGSPETGPFVQKQGRWDKELFEATGANPSHRVRKRDMDQALFRMRKAKGSEKLLLGEDQYQDRIGKSMMKMEYYSGIPIIVSKVDYHYDSTGLEGVEKRRHFMVGLPVDTLRSPDVTFYLEFDLLNITYDTLVQVKLTVEDTVLDFSDEGKVEYQFKSPGVKSIFCEAQFASGWIGRNTVELIVMGVNSESFLTTKEKKQYPIIQQILHKRPQIDSVEFAKKFLEKRKENKNSVRTNRLEKRLDK